MHAAVGVGTVAALAMLAGCDKPQDAAATVEAAAPAASSTQAATATGASATAAPSASAASSTSAPDTIIAQHVLVAYKGAKGAPKSVVRTRTEARTRAYEALGKIKAGTPFEDVVKSYSDDAGTVDRMGSIGKRQRQDLDPAFAAAAFALPVGGVSDVVESPFGFHVIKRTQ
jgi:parvulin-like peptidyl-prolyl isomerase